ncbi:Ldh family oxidoreductase [Orrella sp. JC864]|uniref:Ldh family oxidoreductase n=1 Tax=Orrella sp. JC864 TaxID=3120298 RepID=UPI0030089E41
MNDRAHARPAAAIDALRAFCVQALLAAGADEPTADAAARAMMHASRLGVDSHGVRLLPHYIQAIEGGRVNGRPRLSLTQQAASVAVLDADDAHGALATYRGMEQAVALAGRQGIGAVAIRNSSHFGPAGAYALHAAQSGCIGLVFCNSDSFVRLHDGASRFHGTNPIACAVPAGSGDPWLLDMATSAIPYNRVRLYQSLGLPLPQAVASDERGRDVRDAAQVDMLAPLGGEFGFKGAALAGLAEILSAALSGMKFSSEIAPMAGPDFSTPRGLGAFVMAIDPRAFLPADLFQAAMTRYLQALRSSPAREGAAVLAPGDREWAVARERAAHGVPVDPDTEAAFRQLSERFGLPLPFGPAEGKTLPG